MELYTYRDENGVLREHIKLSTEEQHMWWNELINKLLNPHCGYIRFALDNLEYLPEFQVSWEDYHRKGYWKKRKIYK